MLFGRVILKTTATFGAFLRLWGVRITPIISKAQKARKRPHLTSDSACSSLSCPLSTLLVASFHIKGLIKSQKKYLWYLYFKRFTLFWSTNCAGPFASPCMRLPFSFSSQLMILVLGTTISWLFHLLKTTCRTINSTILYWSCLLQRVYEILLFASFKWSVQIINH